MYTPISASVVTILVFWLHLHVNGEDPTSTGLYFKLESQVYLPGASVHISDIGPDTQPDRSNAGFALVCVTTNVNTGCCRKRDNANNYTLGNWYYPNGTVVSPPSNINGHFATVRYSEQLRLVRQGTSVGPLGEYRCKIPNKNRTNISASIVITNTTSASTTTPPASTTIMATIVTEPTTADVKETIELSITSTVGGPIEPSTDSNVDKTIVPITGSTVGENIEPSTGYETEPYTDSTVGGTLKLSTGSTAGGTMEPIIDPPSTGLYFMLESQVYLQGSSVHISDIGQKQDNRSNPGLALVCITTNVNTGCCRKSDNANNYTLGDWYYPNGTVVSSPSNINGPFATVRYSQQLRLVSQGTPVGPLGKYRCEIPNKNGTNICASIIITNTTSVTERTTADVEASTIREDTEPSTDSKTIEPFTGYTGEETIEPHTDSTVGGNGEPYTGSTTRGTIELSTGSVIKGTIQSRTDSNDAVIVMVILLILAAVIFAMVVIAVVIILRRSKKSKYSLRESVIFIRNTTNNKSAMKANITEQDNEEQEYENMVLLVKDRMKPISLNDFSAHVSLMHAKRDNCFELEYNSILKSYKLDSNATLIPENQARNRFKNIYPYDFNRVVLNTLPDMQHSDYINASYINGYGRNKVYIAAQGPVVNSVEDFWRMVWESRVPTIVMLTRIFERKKKCEEYWPQTAANPFIPRSGSPFIINLQSSLQFPEFVVRKMTISKTDETDSPVHEVTLFHYLGWPDHGVPANATSVINFIKHVRKSHPYSKEDLMVIHCSAGVGRTGTFITLDYMLERIKTEKSINIYEFVTELRKQRVSMVQTLVQYIFIHTALDELLTCGDTEVTAANMRIVIKKLSQPIEEGLCVTGFHKQFQTLKKMTGVLSNVDFSQSMSAVNADKNRYDNKITFDYTRVRLRFAGVQGSDYINASFLEGYRQKRAYIATQGPLPHTVNDFWRMVWEYECRCIVMLCKSQEYGKDVSHRYWPQSKGSSEKFGKLVVKLADQKLFSEYVMRKLEVSEDQSKISVTPQSLNITQFHYLSWPEDSVPNTTSTILEITNLVQKVQMSTGNKPIIVMCSDGVGRSGAFICMHAQMERMKAEAVVDVFQFIKSVRFQRAGLVANKDQYEFCYQVLADFLDEFDAYTNFKELI